MDVIISLLTTLNSLSPLAVVALLALIIFMLIKGKQEVNTKVAAISDNHLSGLPEIASDIRTIVETLQRLEVKVSEDFSYIKARINGGPRV